MRPDRVVCLWLLHRPVLRPFRHLGIAMAPLLLAVAASLPAAAQTWIEFRQPEIGYSVEMPGKWSESSRDIQSVMGPTKIFIATVDMGARAYITMYSSYEAEAVRARTVKAILDGAREGAVANVKGKLRTEVDMMLGPHPGRQIIVETPNLVLINRYALVGNALVQAIVAGPQGMESEPVTVRFLGSLKTLNP